MLENVTTLIFDVGGTLKKSSHFGGKYKIFNNWRWYTDVEKQIPELAKKYKIVIAGNQPSKALKKIEESSIRPYITKIFLSEDMGLEKPSKDFFQHVLAELDLAPEEVAYVGNDLKYDIKPSQELGIKAIWLKRPYNFLFTQNLFHLNTKPDIKIKRLKEIK